MLFIVLFGEIFIILLVLLKLLNLVSMIKHDLMSDVIRFTGTNTLHINSGLLTALVLVRGIMLSCKI